MVLLYLSLTEIGNHFQFVSDCIVSITEGKYELPLKVVEYGEPILEIELSFDYTCYDIIGNEVFSCKLKIPHFLEYLPPLNHSHTHPLAGGEQN